MSGSLRVVDAGQLPGRHDHRYPLQSVPACATDPRREPAWPRVDPLLSQLGPGPSGRV
jgi:hypothetical protein